MHLSYYGKLEVLFCISSVGKSLSISLLVIHFTSYLWMQVRNLILILNSIFCLLPSLSFVVEDVTRTKSRSRFKKQATKGSADNWSNPKLLKDNIDEARIKWMPVEFVSSIWSPKNIFIFGNIDLEFNYRHPYYSQSNFQGNVELDWHWNHR